MGWIYILRCADGSYYVGSTINLERRLWEHNESPDLGATYTRRRRPVELLWSADFPSIAQAYWFEKQVQGWNRKKREALMRGDFDALIALARRKGVQERELAQALEEMTTSSSPRPALERVEKPLTSPGCEARP